jgi:predicted flap endonuclease-1-like 5' DNA nuclease
MTSLTRIEGIGETFAQRLREAGIGSAETLLRRGASPEGRREIADRTRITASQILQWVNRADLLRVKGVGQEYSDLLVQAGVDTVPELAQRDAGNLHQKLLELNKRKELVRAVPTSAQVTSWVEYAKQLPRAVTY